MKLKDGLLLRQIAKQFVIVPIGKRTQEVQNMVYISSSAAYLWQFMQDSEFTVESLTDKIMTHYTGVTQEIAQADVQKFIEVLKRNSMLVPEPGEPEAVGGWVRVKIKNDQK